jgi:hypothetical protein
MRRDWNVSTLARLNVGERGRLSRMILARNGFWVGLGAGRRGLGGGVVADALVDEFGRWGTLEIGQAGGLLVDRLDGFSREMAFGYVVAN